jgi:DnaK suppressor protein
MIDNDFTTRLPDPADQAAAIEEERLALAIKIREQARQQEQDARQTFDDEGNVLCDDCGSVIPQDRLSVVPYAVLCVGCKQANEINDKRYS